MLLSIQLTAMSTDMKYLSDLLPAWVIIGEDGNLAKMVVK